MASPLVEAGDVGVDRVNENSHDLLFFYDNFESIGDILDTDTSIQEQFLATESEIQSGTFVCDICKKTCKSKGGLTRHFNAKHKAGNTSNEDSNPQVFTTEILKLAVRNVQEKVAGNKCLKISLKEELTSYSYEESVMGEERFREIAKISSKFEASGNIEKFYSNFYSTVCLKATNYFTNLSDNAATLLAAKVAEFILVYYKRKAAEIPAENLEDGSPSMVLSGMEIAGLQYLGGYVLYNLHKKLKNSTLWDSQANHQSVAILKAAKLDSVSVETHELVGCLSRGRLWAITSHAQKIFEVVEKHFKVCTSKPNLKQIDLEAIVSKSLTDSELLSNYDLILTESELASDKNVAMDLLQNIIALYARVRSFSFARDIIQQFKLQGKAHSKAKALRKEIKQASDKSCET